MTVRNDLTLYDHASVWWEERPLWLRILRNLVPARLRYLADAGVEVRGRTALDVGCGGGYLSEALAEQGAHVIGLDPAPAAIEAAREHARARGLAIDYRVGRGEDLPLPDATVDLVACADVLEHVEDPERVVAESARVLRPGGAFFFDTINRNPLAAVTVVHLGETILRLGPQGVHDPARFLRPRELRATLRRHGLEPAPFVGLGPVGIDRHGALRFGRYPVRWVQYMGHATKPADARPDAGPKPRATLPLP